MGGFVISPLPPVSVKDLQNSRAPSLHGHYPASSLLRAPPPPSRLRPISRGRRLYGLPGSAAFAVGRGGLLQLLDVPLSPCRRSHPAGASRRVSRAAAFRAAFALRLRARPPGLSLSGPPLRSLSLRPGDSPAIPRMTVSMGFRSFGFPPACHPSYGVSALPPAGLPPAEHICLFWTHDRTCSCTHSPSKSASANRVPIRARPAASFSAALNSTRSEAG